MANRKSATRVGVKNGNGNAEGGRLLSAADLFSGGDNALTRVDIPEITVNGEPGYVFVRPLSSRAVVEFLQLGKDEDGKDSHEAQNTAMIKVIVNCTVDADRRPVFTTDDVEKLRDMRMSAFNRISSAIMREMNLGNDLATAEGKGADSEVKVDASSASPTA